MNVSCSQMSIFWTFIDFMSGSSRRKTKTCFFCVFSPFFQNLIQKLKLTFLTKSWTFFYFFVVFFVFCLGVKCLLKNVILSRKGGAPSHCVDICFFLKKKKTRLQAESAFLRGGGPLFQSGICKKQRFF